ncbi:Tetratricopeptide repeat (TPR)-like superfamily protein [Quillaja saponaria]|uniref:Tetratricopeptide repeat (TPR)-like superfamily protein n=1 Tax=Quillaja saponaria TaxID=32244 RepID=A0AAD7PPS7_QUISA|nr:Tetratricopeptide repeat (TPR)-like superfamily protein [Quillaja saponaria]
MKIPPMSITTRTSGVLSFQIRCCDSKPSRGFGTSKSNKNKTAKVTTSKQEKVTQQRKSTTKQSGPVSTQAPRVSSQYKGKSINKSLDNISFEERLEAVRRSAREQKKVDEEQEFGAIDYDTPITPENKTIGLGTKIGVGVAVLVFGLVFALGDFLPSGSVGPTEDTAVLSNKLSEEEKATLKARLKKYEATLINSPKDLDALEGAAVTLAELGEYKRAASLLDGLTKEKTVDPDVFRLLGEVKYELKDFEGSVAAYKASAKVSKIINFEVLRGLTNALLAAKKPDEAVQFLLASRELLSKAESSATELQKVDPVQVELLLGKAYSYWGHVSDAVAVYDQLISSHSDDFRGYLAKGVILKENNKAGDAERMFIQARFFAPVKAKALVDRYSRQ